MAEVRWLNSRGELLMNIWPPFNKEFVTISQEIYRTRAKWRKWISRHVDSIDGDFSYQPETESRWSTRSSGTEKNDA